MHCYNICISGFSAASDAQSQGPIEFSSSNLGFSEDSNSQDSANTLTKLLRPD